MSLNLSIVYLKAEKSGFDQVLTFLFEVFAVLVVVALGTVVLCIVYFLPALMIVNAIKPKKLSDEMYDEIEYAKYVEWASQNGETPFFEKK